MAAKKMTKKEAEARRRAAEQINPITGKGPNQFTAVTNQALPDPIAVHAFTPAGGATERRRLRSLHREAIESGSADAPLGYRKPEGVSDAHFAWLTGAHRMFPNTAAERGTPSIDEPHEVHPGVPAMRRAEDLTKREYDKGTAILQHYGHGPNAMESLKDVNRRNLHRVIGEHIQAGVNESGSQMFYGGVTTTDEHNGLDDEALDAHETGVMGSRNRFNQFVRETATHPDFVAKTGHLTHRQRMHAATQIAATTTADTSPQMKWRENDSWPNIEAAQEASHAALEGRPHRLMGGYPANYNKAAWHTLEMVNNDHYDASQFPASSPKTPPFRGALIDKDSPDAFKVTDIHEASAILPGAPTAKSLLYRQFDEKQNPIKTALAVHPDTPKSVYKDAMQIYKEDPDTGTVKPATGKSRPEEMLEKGNGIVHALNDYATRSVLASHGLSRGVNYADNVHSSQAAVWGSQQMRRGDISVSHADQYPVVRDWGAEGSTPEGLRKVFPEAPTSLGPQFRRNPNTTERSSDGSHDVTRTKPYPLMPGE